MRDVHLAHLGVGPDHLGGAGLEPEPLPELLHLAAQIAFDDVVYIIPYYEQAIQAYRVDRFTGWLTGFAKVELSDVSSLVVIEAVK